MGQAIVWAIVAGKGSGKCEFPRGGSIETARFQGSASWRRPSMGEAVENYITYYQSTPLRLGCFFDFLGVCR